MSLRVKRFHVGICHDEDLRVRKSLLEAEILDMDNAYRHSPLDKRHRHSVEIGKLRVIIALVSREPLEHQGVAHHHAYPAGA